jgi:hypothetical protein
MSKKNVKPDIYVSNLSNNNSNNKKPKNVVNNNCTDDNTSKLSSHATDYNIQSEKSNDSDSDSISVETNTNDTINIPEIKDAGFTTKEQYLFKSVDKFYRKDGNKYIQTMVDIIEENSVVSLRLIEFFVTKYATDAYKFKFPVHISYKAQLKAYKKRYFDPFKRKKKFLYSYYIGETKKKLHTTIGQLNFFEWAFENEIVDYVFKHREELIKAMKKANRNDKKIKNKKTIDTHKIIKPEKEVKKKNDSVELCTTLSFD